MIEVLKQALEALYPISHNSTDDYRGQADKAIASLRQAISELEQRSIEEMESQEPVAWMDADGNVSDNNDHKCFPIPLYTHPPQEQQSCDKRTWVGLTDGEVDDAARYCVKSGQSVNAAIRAIEAKLKEKNT